MSARSCQRCEGMGVTPLELLTPGTPVMVAAGQANAIVNGGPSLVAWATVIGPADQAITQPEQIGPDTMWWLTVYFGPAAVGALLEQMYRADEILGVPALGLYPEGVPAPGSRLVVRRQAEGQDGQGERDQNGQSGT